jgi:SNF2 family DNA or RNA helicase
MGLGKTAQMLALTCLGNLLDKILGIKARPTLVVCNTINQWKRQVKLHTSVPDNKVSILLSHSE